MQRPHLTWSWTSLDSSTGLLLLILTVTKRSDVHHETCIMKFEASDSKLGTNFRWVTFSVAHCSSARRVTYWCHSRSSKKKPEHLFEDYKLTRTQSQPYCTYCVHDPSSWLHDTTFDVLFPILQHLNNKAADGYTHCVIARMRKGKIYHVKLVLFLIPWHL